MPAKKSETKEVQTVNVKMGRIGACLVGTTPLIMHRMAEKAKRELLLPRGTRMTAADKATNLKHDPIEEYRASMYQRKDGETALVFPGAAFHKALADAALDIPNAKKAQIGRLCGVEEFNVAIYGIPQLAMSVVRMSDIGRTPDIRTRGIIPQWACQITVRHTIPMVRAPDVLSLLGAAGIFIGIGDNRQQKGSGSFGLWEIVSPDDREFVALKKHGTRAVQLKAIEQPAMYDEETRDLFEWYGTERKRREEIATHKPARMRDQSLEEAEDVEAAER